MRNAYIKFLFLICVTRVLAQPNWPVVKDAAMPVVAIPSEFTTPYKQSLSVGGWEDGIFISRDGLNLYCLYVPVDLFSLTFFGSSDATHYSSYSRGPTFGMDLITNPVGASEWLQADILYSHRYNAVDSFTTWQISNMANPVYSEGAPQINSDNSSVADLFVFTSNHTAAPDYSFDIALMRKTAMNPPLQETFLPAPVNTKYKEDNPHIERIDSLNLVLFFDSPDRPNGVGQLDIWCTTSADDGYTWTEPFQVSTLNTANSEQQPHLFKDNTLGWYIYYTGSNPTTGLPEIYRAKQGTAGDWNSWTSNELVIGAGNAYAVGEPTLTKYGDISFVLIYADTVNGTSTDKYDADPWFLPKVGSPLSINDHTKNVGSSLYAYPNPANETVNIEVVGAEKENYKIEISDLLGRIVYRKELTCFNENCRSVIGITALSKGSYFISLTGQNCRRTVRLVKE